MGKSYINKGLGYRNIEKQKPITPETIFGIASVTKSFTAMCIMKLEEQSLLSISDPVTKYIPEFRLQNVPQMENIKIYHLLSHTTGLPPVQRREDIKKLNDHITYLSSQQVEMLGKPGTYFSYCNDSFLLLGLIIERITGQLFRRYVTENILTPLKMYRSTFSLEEVDKFDNVSVPYDYNKKKAFEKQTWPTLGNYEVGGGIRSNVLDLIKYGHQYLSLRTNTTQIISKAQISRMFSPSFYFNDHSFYGLGLSITENYSGVTLVEHGGGQPGVSSHFGVVPEKDMVVAVLTNVSGAPSSVLWLAAVNSILNLPLEKKRRIEPKYDSSYRELVKFAGTYSSAEGSSLTIYLQNNLPTAVIEGESFNLRQSREDTLVFSQTEMPLRFYLDGDQAWAVLFGSRMLRRSLI
jgi:CubicO group peptidase (beta-lactamase class C family)